MYASENQWNRVGHSNWEIKEKGLVRETKRIAIIVFSSHKNDCRTKQKVAKYFLVVLFNLYYLFII